MDNNSGTSSPQGETQNNTVTNATNDSNPKQSRAFSITSIVTASLAFAISLFSWGPHMFFAAGDMWNSPYMHSFTEEYFSDSDESEFEDSQSDMMGENFDRAWKKGFRGRMPFLGRGRGGMLRTGGLISWGLGRVTFPLAVIGLVFGILGVRKKGQGNLPIIGIVLAAVALFM